MPRRHRRGVDGLPSYALTDGAVQTPEEVAVRLGDQFAVVDQVAARAGLSQRCLDKIDKAEERRALLETADSLLAPLRAPEHPLRARDPERRDELEVRRAA